MGSACVLTLPATWSPKHGDRCRPLSQLKKSQTQLFWGSQIRDRLGA